MTFCVEHNTICLFIYTNREVMSTPVVVLRTMETFGRIKEIVDDPTSHNGYPIVDEYDPTDVSQMMILCLYIYIYIYI